MGDDGVALVVADALLLIVEMGVFNKFQEQVEEGCCRDTLRDQITEQIDKDREKRLQLYADEGDDEDGRTIPIVQQVEDGLILSKISEIIQSKFIRSFLGPQGFASYLQYNNNLQNMFKFTQKDDESEKDKLLMPEREEIIVRFYRPPSKRKGHRYDEILAFMSGREKQLRKRMTKSPCSARNRARSQLLKKQRETRTGVVSGSVFDF